MCVRVAPGQKRNFHFNFGGDVCQELLVSAFIVRNHNIRQHAHVEIKLF